MIGLVLVAHAGLAMELLNAAEMIVGRLEKAEAIGITAKDSVEQIRDSVSGAIEKVSGAGVIIMTDMFGGTPSNMSISFLKDNEVEVITGVNLPMVIKFASDRDKLGVEELAATLKKCGLESISVAGDYLK
ncbi:MAG: PTS sugar transporter subunit IIA [Deltaproteobacteria bacterium]|nr:PTS sugar transporter subunit IIA [Deltaproteobacteria bacterium]TLN03087.1 MAG: PTS sugar transporter subunit IIA [bacterium]